MKPKTRGFTLVEIVIVALVIGILMAIAIPQMLHARATSQTKTCIQNLVQMEQAKEEYAMAAQLADGALVSLDELVPAYMNAYPDCPANGAYTLEPIGQDAICSVPLHTLVGTGFGTQITMQPG